GRQERRLSSMLSHLEGGPPRPLSLCLFPRASSGPTPDVGLAVRRPESDQRDRSSIPVVDEHVLGAPTEIRGLRPSLQASRDGFGELSQGTRHGTFHDRNHEQIGAHAVDAPTNSPQGGHVLSSYRKVFFAR